MIVHKGSAEEVMYKVGQKWQTNSGGSEIWTVEIVDTRAVVCSTKKHSDTGVYKKYYAFERSGPNKVANDGSPKLSIKVRG